MGRAIDFSLFLASLGELHAAAPGWKARLAEPVKLHLINPFTTTPVELSSTHPTETFEDGTPTKLDLSNVHVAPVEGIDNGDLEDLAHVSRRAARSDARCGARSARGALGRAHRTRPGVTSADLRRDEPKSGCREPAVVLAPRVRHEMLGTPTRARSLQLRPT